MTIAIALAVIAVLAGLGVWLLRRQAALQRDFGPAPHIEDGPPGDSDPDASGPAPDAPWREGAPEPGHGTETDADGRQPPRTVVVEEPISSSAPDAVETRPLTSEATRGATTQVTPENAPEPPGDDSGEAAAGPSGEAPDHRP
ncbi:hypothetical protein [Actinacidiphila yeochonensis]|uniref:hypothetical protein n=1 Tax=Actinacidiphila yeochonensis TaxID=89050 RepID=UPI00056A8448|nr:hypothetical protein [Actinacidiphila yeochonensis]